MADVDFDRTRAMSPAEKVGEALRRSLPHLPDEAKQTVRAMLEPRSLAIIAATLAIWAGSHFFGVGEVVDLILLGAGVVTLGFSVFDGARELYDFAEGAVGAKSDGDLDAAGEHFAAAVTILGISAVQAVLLRGQSRVAANRLWSPKIYSRRRPPSPPVNGRKLRVSRPSSLPDDDLGGTDAYGAIEISRDQSITEQRISLYHELVHRYFSPRTGPLRRLRAEVRMSSYARSAFLRYLEEALAEGYGQFVVRGLQRGLRAYRFPITNGYVTVAQLSREGQAVGTIMLGGSLFYVSLSSGPMPSR